MRTKMNSNELRDHVHMTYISLRYGICLLGFLLPIVLLVGGLTINVSWQDSISQYYHTPLRDLFVGSLFGIGAFLYLYKGFSREENIALNISGIALLGVALFPISINQENLEYRQPHADSMESSLSWIGLSAQASETIHIMSALLFFFSIAYVCIRCAGDTLHLIDDPQRRSELKLRYTQLGVLMIVVPSLAAVLDLFDVGDQYHVVFMVEWGAILVFSSYWWTKSREFKGLLDVPEVVICEVASPP